MSDIDSFVNLLANQSILPAGPNADGNLQISDWVPLRQNGVIDYTNRGVDGSVKEETINL